jgi:hypothetical protein
LKCQIDPRSKSEIIKIIDFSGELKIIEAPKRRPNSFKVKDIEGSTIFAAPTKEDMFEWIVQIQKHKTHLRRYKFEWETFLRKV